MRILCIVNPVSGRRNLAGVLERISERLVACGARLDVRLTRSAGQATELAAQADDVRSILVLGGDGTTREVVDGLLSAGRTTPVAILRTGTENLVAREFRMPTHPDAMASLLMSGFAVGCDVGVVNGRHFLAVTGAGFDGEVVRRLASERNGHITHLSYLWPVVRTFGAHRFPEFKVIGDGRTIYEGRGLAMVFVMDRYSINLHIGAKARRDDGMLDVCVYPCESRMQLVGHAIDTVLRRHIDRPGAKVRYQKCKSVEILGDGNVPWEVDGDIGGVLPVRCSIIPQAATFLVPGPTTDS